MLVKPFVKKKKIGNVGSEIDVDALGKMALSYGTINIHDTHYIQTTCVGLCYHLYDILYLTNTKTLRRFSNCRKEKVSIMKDLFGS